MGRKKKIFYKKCATCGKLFNPGRHKEKINCSPECLKKHQQKTKDDRLKKSKEGLLKKYGVDHVSKIPEWGNKVKKTKKEKYGDENYNNREKSKKTTIEKYGVNNTMKIEETKKKSKKTKKEKYGDENYNNRESAKKTIEEKYNTKHHLQTEECLEKMKKTNLELYNTEYTINTKKCEKNLKKHNQKNYNCDWYFESKEHKNKIRKQKIKHLKLKLEKNNLTFDENKYIKIREKNKDGKIKKYYEYELTCKKCNNKFKSRLTFNLPVCRNCYPISSCSKLNIEFKEFLNSINIEFQENNRIIIKPLELDFYIPSKEIAIELNGNYYHSEISGGKNKNYHINKSELCKKNGIKLIHIFEDEWLLKKDIIKSRIINILGKTPNKIYAKNCEIKSVSNNDKKDFLEKNHIQGDVICSIRYGLYYKNSLVSIMIFSKNHLETGYEKNNSKTYFKLTRFCSTLNTNVIGAFEKLLDHFKKNNNFTSLILYADCRYYGLIPENTIYNNFGFNFVKKTPCNYFFVNKKNYFNRIHRFNLTKKRLIEKFNGDKNKTEWEIAQENNFDRIWDCGSLKFEFK